MYKDPSLRFWGILCGLQRTHYDIGLSVQSAAHRPRILVESGGRWSPVSQRQTLSCMRGVHNSVFLQRAAVAGGLLYRHFLHDSRRVQHTLEL